MGQSGFTIIETLVAIIILGLVSAMGIMVFNQLWGNKAIMMKKEAVIGFFERNAYGVREVSG